MPHRHRDLNDDTFISFKFKPLRLFAALKDRLARGYSRRDFFSDLMSGTVVGLVAIPLGMALAIASGAAPQNGLYTVIIAGFFVALFGGSRFQVTGPTAAFVVVLVPVVAKYGIGGLLLAGLLSGGMLILMGLMRMGRLIEFIPHPVTTGFTSGIALVIATIQIKDFFGLPITKTPETFFERVQLIWHAAPSASWIEFSIAITTLLLLITWTTKPFSFLTFGFNQKIPAPLVALLLVTLGSVFLRQIFPELSFATIQSKFSYVKDGVSFSGIPQSLPSFHWPWKFARAEATLSFELIKNLLPSAFAIAMLGAIESLLSAVVADGMAQTKQRTRHDPDAELIALGIGNLLCPFFGGIPATGAIARTATNIRFGAESPFSAMIHSLFVLLVILLFAPFMGYLPMASLAALLVLVAYNMADLKHFKQILKVAPRSDVVVLLLCFSLTIIFDMIIGVTAGVVLAALFFMARMSALTSGQLISADKHPTLNEPLPKEILLYEIAGPLFFGAAQKAIAATFEVSDQIQVVIFDLSAVPVMDVTGLVALETCFQSLRAKEKIAIVTGIKKQPASLILRANLLEDQKKTFLAKDLKEAVAIAMKSLTPSR